MIFNIIADIPDEDIPVLHSALKIVSDNKKFSEMKKCPDNISALVSAYCSISLHDIYKQFSAILGKNYGFSEK